MLVAHAPTSRPEYGTDISLIFSHFLSLQQNIAKAVYLGCGAVHLSLCPRPLLFSPHLHFDSSPRVLGSLGGGGIWVFEVLAYSSERHLEKWNFLLLATFHSIIQVYSMLTKVWNKSGEKGEEKGKKRWWKGEKTPFYHNYVQRRQRVLVVFVGDLPRLAVVSGSRSGAEQALAAH